MILIAPLHPILFVKVALYVNSYKSLNLLELNHFLLFKHLIIVMWQTFLVFIEHAVRYILCNWAEQAYTILSYPMHFPLNFFLSCFVKLLSFISCCLVMLLVNSTLVYILTYILIETVMKLARPAHKNKNKVYKSYRLAGKANYADKWDKCQ